MNKHDALKGALVADAAAMGLHWMYEQEQIANVAQSGDILFRQPDATVYAGKKSYFAHAGRNAGDYSHYGEAAQMFADLLSSGESYSVDAHRALFMQKFGPGGSFVGYADRPTRALLGRLLIEQDNLPEDSGADDDQLPALAAVPAMFAFEHSRDNLIKAVKVSSVNAVAIEGACTLFDCLHLLSQGASLKSALTDSAQTCKGELGELLTDALKREPYDPLAAANTYGMPCHIPQGLPVVWHMLNHDQSFETLIRDNVACGGDSCGRALALGAIVGYTRGVPASLEAQIRADL